MTERQRVTVQDGYEYSRATWQRFGPLWISYGRETNGRRWIALGSLSLSLPRPLAALPAPLDKEKGEHLGSPAL